MMRNDELGLCTKDQRDPPNKVGAEKHRLERRWLQMQGRIEKKPNARRPYRKFILNIAIRKGP